MPAVPVLPVAQDQSVHRDPRDAGPGVMPTAPRAFRSRQEAASLYGDLDLREFTVLPRSRSRKSAKDAPFDKVCYIGCGVTDRHRRGAQHREGAAGAKAIVFGLGGIGLNVIQGLRLAGADMIIGVDLNNDKNMGRAFRHDAFRQSKEIGKDLVPFSST
jgi:S-(hydroxymethyl)glutathione dehydrogenase/alcohol dehydrogenase